MKQITRWSPDTCECVIDYEWDDSVPESERTHTISKVIKRCAEHEKMALKDKEHFTQVTNENVAKNKAFEIVKAKTPIDADNFKYSFDKDRKLVVDVSNLNLKSKDKIALISELNTKLGGQARLA